MKNYLPICSTYQKMIQELIDFSEECQKINSEVFIGISINFSKVKEEFQKELRSFKFGSFPSNFDLLEITAGLFYLYEEALMVYIQTAPNQKKCCNLITLFEVAKLEHDVYLSMIRKGQYFFDCGFNFDLPTN